MAGATTILVVDDDAAILKLLGAMLGADGYRVLTAPSAEEAFRLLGLNEDGPPPSAVDLIVLDILMPRMSGLEACGRLKEHEHLREVPIIIATASGHEQDMESAFASGAVDFISKPLRAVEVRTRIRSALKLRESKAALQSLVVVDPLTQIANRRAFDHALANEWRRAARDHAPISLILADVDHFKAYNDHYGHPAGDECLKEVARALASVGRRPADLAARYGGEEFALVLGATDEPAALLLAQRVEQAVAALALPHAGAPSASVLSLSLGTATVVPRPDQAQSELGEAADRALYEAKRTGRNRIVQARAFSLE